MYLKETRPYEQTREVFAGAIPLWIVNPVFARALADAACRASHSPANSHATTNSTTGHDDADSRRDTTARHEQFAGTTTRQRRCNSARAPALNEQNQRASG